MKKRKLMSIDLRNFKALDRRELKNVLGGSGNMICGGYCIDDLETFGWGQPVAPITCESFGKLHCGPLGYVCTPCA